MNPTYSKQSESFLNKQSKKQVARIKKAINALPAGDIKKLKSKTWDDIEEDEPTPDEVDAIEQYLASK